jgi:hypothetical protein
MDWCHVINYTKLGIRSFSKFKYGRAELNEILHDNPTWSATDIIVGGSCADRGYFLINGYKNNRLTHLWDSDLEDPDRKLVGFDIDPIGGEAYECKCGALLRHGSVIAYKYKDYYMPSTCKEDMEHCSYCHNIWDGHAQCMCLNAGSDSD